ncbi:MAG TPA: YeeE/YedE family protein [Candidatus Avacidaminococcus intestinavium]|uniref:YeeE/YedE family protein n=1 Tax=Candidatus Avacidaminococcus intestinavium TaxID=2840684 RepID=A0A9D1SMG8_9FIRM|nr:YeeE/YedE family protein [Candidatus Avacidaminococcus intestinavium]
MSKKGYWSPYLAGGLSGVVAIASLWFSGKFLGASTTFVKSAGMIESIFAAETVAQMPYFMKNTPVIDWQWMFVIGIGIGAFLAALTGGTFSLESLPSMWRKNFGETPKKRALIAFGGGIIAMFGARLADGCPSGHGLAGASQLAVSGFVALFFFFIGGVISANLLYKGGGKR